MTTKTQLADLGGTAAGAEALTAVLGDPAYALVALDFDGTLAPIVDDPEQAYAHSETLAAFSRLGHRCLTAVITGRPVRTAVQLGAFDRAPGLEHLVVLGQYGVERWDAATGEFTIPPAAPEIVELGNRLPALLQRLGYADLHVEDKTRALAVHTRRASDPDRAFAAVAGPLTELGGELGLQVEPGRHVVELRPAGQDKGQALRALVAERGIRSVVYAGDDLGDLPAFEVVAEMREQGGVPGLLICSGSVEQDALEALADVTCPGPAGVARWLARLADLLDGS